jgi:hypothetical protein
MSLMRRVLPVLLVAAVFLTYIGCGDGGALSVSEYRGRTSQTQDGVLSGLEDVSESLESGPHDDYWVLMEIEEVFKLCSEAFISAGKDASGITPPPQADSLHQDLSSYYLLGEINAGSMIEIIAFFQSVLPMLVDMGNLALTDLEADAALPEIEAASIEDHKTLEGYLKDLRRMRTSVNLKGYRDDLIDLYRELDDSITILDHIAASGDKGALAEYQQEYTEVLERVDEFWKRAVGYLGLLQPRIEYLIMRGEELSARIERL